LRRHWRCGRRDGDGDGAAVVVVDDGGGDDGDDWDWPCWRRERDEVGWLVVKGQGRECGVELGGGSWLVVCAHLGFYFFYFFGDTALVKH